MNKQLKVACYTYGLLFSILARAECSYPKSPESPDPASASEAQMIEAMKAFKQYNTDVDAYVSCLDSETNEKIKEAGAAASIVQIKAIQSKKKSAATEERQAKVDAFNKAVRAFKAKG